MLTLAAVLGWAFYPPLKIQYQESREQARLEAELASLKERNESLSVQVERLRTPEGVEEVARESLGMVKEGENLYVVIDPAEETSTLVPESSEEEAAPGSVWNGLLDLVFGVR
ncbi:MAG: septum formation initiator family protein [Coriobacteriia bacterium]|nr:septum formation initiator family protein [Coriobacteriia bacterium]